MLGSADGLGSPPDIWQDGDIIIQRHRFALSQEQLSGLAGDFAYILRTGVYWLDSGERWRVVPGAGVESVPDNADALFIPLTP